MGLRTLHIAVNDRVRAVQKPHDWCLIFVRGVCSRRIGVNSSRSGVVIGSKLYHSPGHADTERRDMMMGSPLSSRQSEKRNLHWAEPQWVRWLCIGGLHGVDEAFQRFDRPHTATTSDQVLA